MRFGVWDPHGNPGRRPKDRAAAVRGHPQENPGRRPKNRAGVVAVLLRCDCFGGTTHREVSALTRIPSSKRDKIINVAQNSAVWRSKLEEMLKWKRRKMVDRTCVEIEWSRSE